MADAGEQTRTGTSGATARIGEVDERFSGVHRWTLAAIVGASLAGLAPGMVRSLWIDDIYRTFSTWVSDERWWSWVLRDAHNPLYNVFMRGWIRVFGDGEIAVRVPSALAAYATAAALVLWTRRRFGPWTAVGAGGLFLLNPMVLLHATMAKNNLWTVFLAFATVVSMDLLRERPSRRLLVLGVTVTTLALYTDWATLVLIGPAWVVLVGSVLRRGARTEGLSRWTIALVVGVPLVLIAPLAAHKLGHPESLHRWYLRPFDLVELWHLVFNWLLWGNAIVPEAEHRDLITLAGTIVGLPLLLCGARRAASSASGRLVIVCVALPLAAMLGISWMQGTLGGEQAGHLYQERNLLPVLPMLAVLVAAGGVATRSPATVTQGGSARRVSRLGRARVGLLGVLLAANALGTGLMWTVHAEAEVSSWPRADFRGMARVVADRAAQQEGKTLLISVPMAMPMRYYLRDRIDAPGVVIRHPSPPTTLRDVDRLTRRTGATEVLLLVETPLQSERWLGRTSIEHRWRFEERARFGGLTLYRLDPREPG